MAVPARASGDGADDAASAASSSSSSASTSSGDEGEEPSLLERTDLSLASHPLPALDGMTSTLSQFANLHKLDLSSLQPSDENPDGLTTLSWLGKAVIRSQRAVSKGEAAAAFGDRLTWLNLSGNAGLDDDGAEGLECFKTLFVLNLSHCALAALPLSITPLKTLKALVLNNNLISTLPTSFPHLPELNTLILSHNKLASLPATLPAAVPALKKLSISHNDLESAASLPDLSPCLALREVRMTGNKRLGSLPAHIQRWGKGADGKTAPGLEVLDCGDCGLQTWDDISPLVEVDRADGGAEEPKRRRGLANLSLRGNGVTQLDGYKDRLTGAHPTLKILDNERIVAKVHPVSREQKRQEARQEARMLRKAGVQSKDSGYANVRAKRDGAPAPTSASRPSAEGKGDQGADDDGDDDDDDEEAARMAEEMRRARRQMDGGPSTTAAASASNGPDASRHPKRDKDGTREKRGAKDRGHNDAAQEAPVEGKKKHKRGGARVRKGAKGGSQGEGEGEGEGQGAATPDRPAKKEGRSALNSSFFEVDDTPAASTSTSKAQSKAKQPQIREGVEEDATAVPASSGNVEPGTKRARRSGKKRRELDMDVDDDDDDDGADVSSSSRSLAASRKKATAAADAQTKKKKDKKKQDEKRSKRPREKMAWDAGSAPSTSAAKPTTPTQATASSATDDADEARASGAGAAAQQRSSVAKIIDLTKKRKHSTSASGNGDVDGEDGRQDKSKRKKTKSLPFALAAKATAGAHDVVVGSGTTDAWANAGGASAWD
ncbi:uncharacterized protein PFL1_01375 [Pseudozyma flocculosa PF-1]|uniref:uncharacterized protein n=1 Tax=Pseudozyma flocculosa PF-1 TaxID=1277687 RepID=UPI0004560B0C|nr:uncharacterized protein PFL1_01375 [Pseudozyma flocculosa PF-1]EPQ31187.1 hypothetical protein PFL1_01375 [Pseudozyma flocculosa PF-1]